MKQLTPQAEQQKIIEQELQHLFDALCHDEKEGIKKDKVWEILNTNGIYANDPRLSGVREAFDQVEGNLDKAHFFDIASQSALLRNGLTGQLVIPDFESFSEFVEGIYDEVKTIKRGKVADYIPQLARVNPDLFAVSVCTIDGQQFSLGDYKQSFCLQSTCKPIIYCIAQEDVGAHKVHQHVGFEPSGLGFNEISLDRNNKPHNPMINAGAIMCSSLIKRDSDIADKFDHVMSVFKDLCSQSKVGFNNAVYLSERQTADRNFALAYYMREHNAFPPKTDIRETLDFYFQACSIEANAQGMAQIGATLANSGVDPFNEKKVFRSQTVQNCLSLMHTCGMYDYSGEFAFKIGLPAKSGVSGGLLLVIPDLMGICVYSPLLDHIGNSIKGVKFSKRLAEKYNVHKFRPIGATSISDITSQRFEESSRSIYELLEAARQGDTSEVQRIMASGTNLDSQDYDGRTALHLAAAEGQDKVVHFLLENNANTNLKDRWGHTAISEAEAGKHKEVIKMLKEYKQ